MIDGSITGDPEEIGTVNRVERRRAVSLMGAERLKNPGRPFALQEKLLRCFYGVFLVFFLSIGVHCPGQDDSPFRNLWAV